MSFYHKHLICLVKFFYAVLEFMYCMSSNLVTVINYQRHFLTFEIWSGFHCWLIQIPCKLLGVSWLRKINNSTSLKAIGLLLPCSEILTIRNLTKELLTPPLVRNPLQAINNDYSFYMWCLYILRGGNRDNVGQ